MRQGPQPHLRGDRLRSIGGRGAAIIALNPYVRCEPVQDLHKLADDLAGSPHQNVVHAHGGIDRHAIVEQQGDEFAMTLSRGVTIALRWKPIDQLGIAPAAIN